MRLSVAPEFEGIWLGSIRLEFRVNFPMGALVFLHSANNFISLLNLAKMATFGDVWLDEPLGVCNPVTWKIANTISYQGYKWKFIHSWDKNATLTSDSLSFLFFWAEIARLPYILRRAPQELILGCSCCNNFWDAICFPSLLFRQMTSTTFSLTCIVNRFFLFRAGVRSVLMLVSPKP